MAGFAPSINGRFSAVHRGHPAQANGKALPGECTQDSILPVVVNVTEVLVLHVSVSIKTAVSSAFQAGGSGIAPTAIASKR
jgi:hypothetical protein